MSTPQQNIKRVTIEVSNQQHKRLKDACERFDTTQPELIGYLIDITLTNPDVVKKQVDALVAKRKQEEAKNRETEEKAKRLINSLSPEALTRLLAGEIDLSRL